MASKRERQRRARPPLRCLVAVAIAALMVLGSRSALAAVFSIAGGDVAGLVTAINAANGNGEADVIALAAGTYWLNAVAVSDDDGASGLPTISSEIAISGADPNSTVIERQGGSPAFRIFQVAKEGLLTVSGVTIRGGLADSGGTSERRGGGIHNRGMLRLENTVVENNEAEMGGGIYNHDTTTLQGVTLRNNTAALKGGGVRSGEKSRLMMLNSLVYGNTAEEGGGVNTWVALLAITNSTVRNNVAADTGGGIRATLGTVSVVGSTINGNTAGGEGGGVRFRAPSTVTNSTISGNSSGSHGGGLFSGEEDQTRVINSTIAYNTAGTGGVEGDGGGVFNAYLGRVILRNTIVAGNTTLVGAGPDCAQSSRGNIHSEGHNLIQNPADCPRILEDGATDIVGLDPLLAALGDIGGPTAGHALLPGSPAIDEGDDSSCLGIDQRGFARPADGDGDATPVCDLGAYEAASTAFEISSDHFLCYKARPKGSTPKFTPTTVSLAGAFEPGEFRVRKTKALCLPADKNGEGIVDADTHLKAYKVRRSAGEPKHVPRLNIEVRNQFGRFFVDTKKEEQLLVPAGRDLQVPAIAPDPASHDVDHSLCYKVKLSRNEPKPTDRNVQALVVDQFDQMTLFDLRKPQLLCRAVDKNGEGIKDAAAHLLCFRPRSARYATRFKKRSAGYVADQFGLEQLDVKQPQNLCIPSFLTAGS